MPKKCDSDGQYGLEPPPDYGWDPPPKERWETEGEEVCFMASSRGVITGDDSDTDDCSQDLLIYVRKGIMPNMKYINCSESDEEGCRLL